MSLCEVRIPTYKRPDLLKRALDSLIAQHHTEWAALVMDDSPDREGKYIVDSFNDDRIKYTPNAVNLGCAKNINQAFSSKPLAKGKYAFILEDDNWLMPTFISDNIQSLENNNINILLRNQSIQIQKTGESKPTSRTTKGRWLTRKVYSPLELHGYLFFCEGISNGGLFWRTSLTSDLQVDDSVTDAGLQEYCRTSQITDDLLFEDRPLCYWAEMSDELSLRNSVRNRQFGRGLQSLKSKLINVYGTDIVIEAAKIALRLKKQREFERSLLDTLYLKHNYKIFSLTEQIHQLSKSYIKSQFITNPLQDYYLRISQQHLTTSLKSNDTIFRHNG